MGWSTVSLSQSTDLPQGILPIELSGITQDWLLANATVAEGGVSSNNPQIFVKKKTIFHEMLHHEDKSDFFSFKDLLEVTELHNILLLKKKGEHSQALMIFI